MNYTDFISSKSQLGGEHGFAPMWIPDSLYPFQRHLVEWATRKGRAAIFADCGLGKTPMQLVWAENVCRKTDGRVLILTPLAVAPQTVREAHKFGVDAQQSRDGVAAPRVTVTNYEKLHLFNPDDFDGVVCDESSILKHYTGATQKSVTRFLSKKKYRTLWTATAAPNDYVELGTSSEAIGELTHSEMLTRFFKYLDDKGQSRETRDQVFAEKAGQYYGKLAFRVAQTIGQWRLKNHAVQSFWRWVASWARACRNPSDIGFDNTGFELPPLNERQHIIMPDTPQDGFLFVLTAFGLGEEREERKRTLKQRCGLAAELANHDRPAVIWCHTNDEGNTLEKMVTGSRQVSGATPDDEKEEIYNAFSDGSLAKLVIKPKIGAWGLNWQHCSHTITFASHSYEQYYQSVRRFWRFGQKSPVDVDVIATEGEKRVIENMNRKASQASVMFSKLVEEMSNAEKVSTSGGPTIKEEIPSWL